MDPRVMKTDLPTPPVNDSGPRPAIKRAGGSPPLLPLHIKMLTPSSQSPPRLSVLEGPQPGLPSPTSPYLFPSPSHHLPPSNSQYVFNYGPLQNPVVFIDCSSPAQKEALLQLQIGSITTKVKVNFIGHQLAFIAWVG